MTQYYTLVAGLPELSPDGVAPDVLETIREGVSAHDKRLVDSLLEGAPATDSKFLKAWSEFEGGIQKAIEIYAMGRMGVACTSQEASEPHRTPSETHECALPDGNILERERALDRLRWRRIDELTVFNYFDTDAVLGYVARLMILRRWSALSPEKGRDFLTTIL